jgi:hypothetical protein
MYIYLELTLQLFLTAQLFSAHLVQPKVSATVKGIICTGTCRSNLQNNAWAVSMTYETAHSMTNCIRPQGIPPTWITTLNANLESSTKLAEEFSELQITAQFRLILWSEHGSRYSFHKYVSTGVHSVDSHYERNDTFVATLPSVTWVKFYPTASNTTITTTTTTTQYFRRPLFRSFILSLLARL